MKGKKLKAYFATYGIVHKKLVDSINEQVGERVITPSDISAHIRGAEMSKKKKKYIVDYLCINGEHKKIMDAWRVR